MRIRFIFSQVFQGLSRNMAMTVSVILVSFVSLLFGFILTATDADQRHERGLV